jgi:uncharacterized protein
LLEYALYFFITLGVSTLFAIVGLGSSLVMIPIFTFFGIDFNLAKAMGLFINGTTTLSITVRNIKEESLRCRKVAPLVIISAIFALLGAYASNYISETFVKSLFVSFILLSLILLFSVNRENKITQNYNKAIFMIFIGFVAFVSGLIGVGGGLVYLPLLLYIGIRTKESIATTSALIPIVSFSAFFTYVTFVSIDWILLGVVSIGAILGGYFGHKITCKMENEKYLKIVISIFLLVIAGYMLKIELLS